MRFAVGLGETARGEDAVVVTLRLAEGRATVELSQPKGHEEVRRRVVRLLGLAIDPRGELRLPPDLILVAESSVDELRSLGLTLRKAEYLLDVARQVADGELDLAVLARAPAAEIEQRLLACRGLGPWSVNYLLMRSFAFADAVPAGDVALAESLKRYFELDERPDPAETRRLMEPFAPYRSLATFHFWNRLGNVQ